MHETTTDWPRPEIDAINRPHWDGLAHGKLLFQRCTCGHARLPPRLVCPVCLSPDFTWDAAAGGGTLVSWVVYHVAYHDAFRDRLPYNVAIVELDEGPRLITNIVADAKDLRGDARVRLAIEREGDVPLARFRLDV